MKITVKINGERIKGELPPGCYKTFANGITKGTAYLVDGRVCYCAMSSPKSTVFRFKGWAK